MELFFVMLIYFSSQERYAICLSGNGFGSYKKLAIFTSNVDADNKTLINHKCVCGALIRQFLVGAVMGWFL